MHRRSAGVVGGFRIGAVLDEQLDGLEVIRLGAVVLGERTLAAPESGGKQDRAAPLAALQRHVCSVLDQDLRGAMVAMPGRAHQRRRPFAERALAGRVIAHQRRALEPGVNVGAARQQQLDEVEDAVFVGHRPRWAAVDLAKRAHVDCGVERRHAGAVGDVRIGSFLQKDRGRVVVRVDDRADECGCSFRIRRVEVSAAPRQRTRGIRRAVACRVHQRRPVAFRQRGEDTFQAKRIPRKLERI